MPLRTPSGNLIPVIQPEPASVLNPDHLEFPAWIEAFRSEDHARTFASRVAALLPFTVMDAVKLGMARTYGTEVSISEDDNSHWIDGIEVILAGVLHATALRGYDTAVAMSRVGVRNAITMIQTSQVDSGLISEMESLYRRPKRERDVFAASSQVLLDLMASTFSASEMAVAV